MLVNEKTNETWTEEDLKGIIFFSIY